MLIQPDTYIRLIKNCPLDKTYNHTIYFNTELEQIGYFKNTLQGISFTKQSYQRYDKGNLQIHAPAETLYDCNYLMFQNTAFGDKYFYAFVTSVEYVNNVTSKITYEIDVMQTWAFNYEIGDCFIEREHPITDNIGENLVPENLATGEFMLNKLPVDNCPFEPGAYNVIIVQGTNKIKVNDEYQAVVSNVFSGLDFIRCSTPSEAYDKLKAINGAGESDTVVAVFMIPTIFWGGTSTANFSEGELALNISNGLENPYPTSFYGYVPKNKKLYTSQYFGLIATSSSGVEHKYAYEHFNDPNNPVFAMSFSVGATPESALTPTNYKGVTINYNEEIMCVDFPQCAYATDAFKEYVALNSGRLLAGLGSTVISSGASVMGQNTSGANAIGNILANLVNTYGLLRDKSVLPPKVRGSGASYMSYTRNSVGFYFYQYHMTREFIEIIDGFFNMYGYATNKVKKPNRNSRPHWNYVKTVNCVIHGGVPANDLSAIEGIYNNGITFWKNGAEIGDYSLDNSPV